MSFLSFRDEYASLQPQIPWTHHFTLGDFETISPEIDKKYYNKAVGLKKIGLLAQDYIKLYTKRGTIAGSTILDVASGEGGHSIAFAQGGAAQVVGVEGRQLYVDRARFVARALGTDNVRFELGDVRKIEVDTVGTFDFVFCSGILHHLGPDDFQPFLSSMAKLTRDTMMIYTHVSTASSVKMFNLVPHVIDDEIRGSLFREHSDNASRKEKETQVRASLDNTFSFWADEESLIVGLKRAGFGAIAKIYEPHAFSSYENRNIRVLMIARKL